MGVCRVRLGVSRVGCVRGVSAARAGCVAGVLRVCQGCVAGCVAGVGRVCRSVARGPRPPPLPSAPVPSRPRVFSTRVCALACRSRHTGLRLPLFFFPPAAASDIRVPRDSRRRPLGTSSSFPRGFKETLVFAWDCFLFSKKRKTHARLLFAVRAARRFYSPSPSSAPHATSRRPHTQLQFSPPRKKHPPAPRGPSTRPGMDAGRPPRCVRARQPSTSVCTRSGGAGLSRVFVWIFHDSAFQTARRQGGASKRRARRCL